MTRYLTKFGAWAVFLHLMILSSLSHASITQITDDQSLADSKKELLSDTNSRNISATLGLKEMDDAELSEVQGQALFVANKIEGTGSIASGSNDVNFYSAGLDAELALNLNIKKLELGRTGPGDANVDILADNVAFGCTANASGDCVDSSIATELRDFILTRPFVQFAVENDESTTLRQVVGIRLGAENAEGPLSIGEFKTFSGFLNATANIELQEQGKGRNPEDVAVTCGPTTGPCTGEHNHSTGVNIYDLNEPFRSLGLDNDQGCVLGVCVAFRRIAVNFDGVNRPGLNVEAKGSRINQAYIQGVNLNSAVNSITSSLGVSRSDFLLGDNVLEFALGIIEEQVRGKIKGQLYNSLGLASQFGSWNNSTTQQQALENHEIPYNISNLHQVEVDSPLFGLSFQNRNIRYPGYQEGVDSGWGMYLPDAFTLNVSEPTTVFVSNIQNGGAVAGNIIGLDPVFDNCWGSATFC